jgi:hypothetical protein
VSCLRGEVDDGGRHQLAGVQHNITGAGVLLEISGWG